MAFLEDIQALLQKYESEVPFHENTRTKIFKGEEKAGDAFNAHQIFEKIFVEKMDAEIANPTVGQADLERIPDLKIKLGDRAGGVDEIDLVQYIWDRCSIAVMDKMLNVIVVWKSRGLQVEKLLESFRPPYFEGRGSFGIFSDAEIQRIIGRFKNFFPAPPFLTRVGHWFQRHWRKLVFAIVAIFLLALMFSPLGPMVFALLPFGAALANAAAWATASVWPMVAGCVVVLSASGVVAHVDYVVAAITWGIGKALKYLSGLSLLLLNAINFLWGKCVDGLVDIIDLKPQGIVKMVLAGAFLMVAVLFTAVIFALVEVGEKLRSLGQGYVVEPQQSEISTVKNSQTVPSIESKETQAMTFDDFLRRRKDELTQGFPPDQKVHADRIFGAAFRGEERPVEAYNSLASQYKTLFNQRIKTLRDFIDKDIKREEAEKFSPLDPIRGQGDFFTRLSKRHRALWQDGFGPRAFLRNDRQEQVVSMRR